MARIVTVTFAGGLVEDNPKAEPQQLNTLVTFVQPGTIVAM